MPLFLNNDEIAELITMRDTMEALEILYREMGEGAAVTAPRSDVHSPTAAAQGAEGPMAHYLKSMSGASPHFGTAALRFSSDIVAWRDTGGGMRREKLPMLPGQRWMGIVLLFSSANGELLAIMNDGVLQRFRVGGANGVSTKYLARQGRRSRRVDRLRLASRHASDGGVRSAQDQKDQSFQPDQSQSRELRQRNQRAGRRRNCSCRFLSRSGQRRSTSSSRRRTRARRFSANGPWRKGCI